jgi:hypothetical protein
MKSLVCGLIGLMAVPSAAYAECAQFVAPPMIFDRPSWSELEKFEASKDLNDNIDIVQTIAGTGQGQLNIDQYSLVIDKNGQAPAELLAEIRANLSNVVFSGSSYTNVEPLDPTSETLWNSNDYRSAVLVFTLASIAGVFDTETGAVVVSCQTPTDFLFSTVKVGSANTYSSPGWHPVSGNRAFGVRDNGDDSLTIFVKAADRVVNAGIFATPLVPNEAIFGQGHQVWLHMLDNLKTRYADRNPREVGSFSQRVDF